MPVDVVAFRPEHAIAFDRLNRDWLERFGLLEPPDETELTAPEQAFLQTGGAIFVAEGAGVVVGVCAMRPWSPDSDEVVKLAVAPSMHRRGIGRLLVQRCIEESRRSASRQMVLISNSRLTGALALYESLGFRYGPVPAVVAEKYRTADIFMSLELASDSHRHADY